MNNAGVMFKLDKQIASVTRKMNEVTYDAMVLVIERIDEVSPVGDVALWKYPQRAPKNYVGGQFRGNWQLGVDSAPTGDLPGNIDPSGVQTVAANISKLPQMASRHKYYLVNNLPYAVRIDQGWSHKAAANHMMARVRSEFAGIVKKVVSDIKAGGGRVR